MSSTNQQPAAAPSKPKACAIVSLVLGIVSFFSPWLWLAIILAGAAIIIGAMSLSKNKKGLASGRGMAIAGLTLGIIGLILSIIFMIFMPEIIKVANGVDATAQTATSTSAVIASSTVKTIK